MCCVLCSTAEQSRRHVEEFVRQRYLPFKEGKCEGAGAAHLPTMQHLSREFVLPSVPGGRYLVLVRAVVKVK